MRFIDTTCPNCGAHLNVDADLKKATCDHCGKQFLIDDEVQHVQYDDAETAGYNFEKGRQRAQNEKAAVSSANQYRNVNPVPVSDNAPKKKTNGCLIAFIIVIVLVVLPALLIMTLIGAGLIAQLPDLEERLASESVPDTIYADSSDQLSQDMIDELYEKSKGYYTASLKNGETINSIDFAGIYFVVHDEVENTYGKDPVYNDIYIVIHVNITRYEEYSFDKYKNYDYYWFAKYSNVELSDDGSTEILDVVNYHSPGSDSPMCEYPYYYTGYPTWDSLYDYEIRPLSSTCEITEIKYETIEEQVEVVESETEEG